MVDRGGIWWIVLGYVRVIVGSGRWHVLFIASDGIETQKQGNNSI